MHRLWIKMLFVKVQNSSLTIKNYFKILAAYKKNQIYFPSNSVFRYLHSIYIRTSCWEDRGDSVPKLAFTSLFSFSFFLFNKWMLWSWFNHHIWATLLEQMEVITLNASCLGSLDKQLNSSGTLLLSLLVFQSLVSIFVYKWYLCIIFDSVPVSDVLHLTNKLTFAEMTQLRTWLFLVAV